MTDQTQTIPRRPVTLLVTFGLVVASLVGAVVMMQRADARTDAVDQEGEQERLLVDSEIVRRADIPRIIEARGFLEGIEEVTISAEVGGRVDRRLAPEGSAVAKGDLLIQIDDTFYEIALRAAEADLAKATAQKSEAIESIVQAEASVDAAKAVTRNAQSQFDFVEGLRKKGSGSEREYTEMETSLRRAQAELESAKASTNRAREQEQLAIAAEAAAKAAVADAEARLARCEVRSPIDGRVNQYALEEGEYAVASSPLVEVVRLDKMKMIAELSGQEVALLKDIRSAIVTTDVIDDRPHKAEVHHIAPKMDPTTRKFQIELHVDNADENLLAGMYGAVVLDCGVFPNILRMPREAVFKHYGAEFCLVAEPSEDGYTAVLRRVEGRPVPGHLEEWEVLAGVGEGDRVITTRHRELRAGTPVALSDSAAPSSVAAGTQP